MQQPDMSMRHVRMRVRAPTHCRPACRYDVTTVNSAPEARQHEGASGVSTIQAERQHVRMSAWSTDVLPGAMYTAPEHRMPPPVSSTCRGLITKSSSREVGPPGMGLPSLVVVLSATRWTPWAAQGAARQRTNGLHALETTHSSYFTPCLQ